MSKQSISRSSGRWRKSRCSDLWYRCRAGGRSRSSPSALIPSTIPKSISDGESRYFSMPASGASGLRTGAAARRLRRNIGCLLITSKSCAMAAHRSIQQTANAFAVLIPVRLCKPGRTGQVLPAGGRGFNSLRSSCPATAPTLMRRFFSWPQTFDFFQEKSSFSNPRQQIPSTKQGRSVGQPQISSIYFPTGSRRSLSKNCREIARGGVP